MFIGGSLGFVLGQIVYGEELDCGWFWDNPFSGWYFVSEINGEHELRPDLYILRISCST